MLQKFLLTLALVGGSLPALAQSQQQGTPQERAACAPAVRKFCKSANEDSMRVHVCRPIGGRSAQLAIRSWSVTASDGAGASRV